MARGALSLDNPEAMGLLAAGLGILANNTGHYGAFAPAFGRGALQGLETYLPLAAASRAEKKRKEASEGLLSAFSKKPDLPKPVSKSILSGKTPNFNPNVPEPTINEFAPNFAEAFGAKIPATPEGAPPIAMPAVVDPDSMAPIVGRPVGANPGAPVIKQPASELQREYSFRAPTPGAEFEQPNPEDLQVQQAAAHQAKQGALSRALGATDGALALQPQLAESIAQTDAIQRGALSQQPQPQANGMQMASANGALSPQQLQAIAEFSNATGDYSLFNRALSSMLPSAPAIETKEINGHLVTYNAQTGQIIGTHKFDKAGEPFTLSPGQKRFGADNQPVAAIPESEEGIKAVREYNAMLDAAGITDPAQRQQMFKDYAARRGSGVNVNVGEKAPAGYRWSGDGQSLEPIPGGPATKVPEAQQKQLIGTQNLRNAIQEYRDSLSGFSGGDWFNPNARALMQSKYQNMLLQAKEAYNLGVLNGPDFTILSSVITDPTSVRGGIMAKETLDKQASELARIMGAVGANASQGSTHEGAQRPLPQQHSQQPARQGSVNFGGKQYNYIGTKNGKPVYQAADGSKIIDE